MGRIVILSTPQNTGPPTLSGTAGGFVASRRKHARCSAGIDSERKRRGAIRRYSPRRSRSATAAKNSRAGNFARKTHSGRKDLNHSTFRAQRKKGQVHVRIRRKIDPPTLITRNGGFRIPAIPVKRAAAVPATHPRERRFQDGCGCRNRVYSAAFA